MQLLRSTESAVRTFQRSKLWRDAPQQYKGAHPMLLLFVRLAWGCVRQLTSCPRGHVWQLSPS
eukprot:scaffold127564_cov18-Tisochrysis_lutea.AAC.3